jgi:O-acetylhomoserine (thiol)-lyase
LVFLSFKYNYLIIQTRKMSTQKFSTNALHAGHDVTQTAGTRAVPIYQTS